MSNRFFLFLLIFLSGYAIYKISAKKPEPEVLSGEYWKNQALKDIMPYWTEHSRDTMSGAFYTTLDSAWNPAGDQNKYPSMVSRHLFSYSTAYLLSGDEEYIRIAGTTARWLMDHAWDSEYGGWYDALDIEGNPVQTTKSTFVQVYAITGLALYYFVTHDTTVLDFIERSNELLETKVWDSPTGGYFNMMDRDWSVIDSKKSFSSEITPVSGYLFYLYLATRDEKYLDQIDRILGITVNKMIDDTSGWILEDFDKEWNYISRVRDGSEINTGHNIEAAWMLFRKYLVTGNPSHLKTGQSLAARIIETGLFNKNDIWLTSAGRIDPSLKGTGTYWWIQAYGNMFSLYLYHTTKDKEYLENFRRGAQFWDSGFMDRKFGDTYFSVDSEGKVTDATKATRFKTSYHSIEHCILNYLCLNLWVNNESVELHFRINSSKNGEFLYPVLIEDTSVKVKSVTGKANDNLSFPIEGQGIRLPELNNYPLTVILTK